MSHTVTHPQDDHCCYFCHQQLVLSPVNFMEPHGMRSSFWFHFLDLMCENYLCACVYPCAHVCACACVCTRACVRACVCMCVRVCGGGVKRAQPHSSLVCTHHNSSTCSDSRRASLSCPVWGLCPFAQLPKQRTAGGWLTTTKLQSRSALPHSAGG